MKFIILILLLSLSVLAHALDCDLLNPLPHTNPDGTPGGLVDSRAFAASTARVALGAKICGQARVEGNAQILDHSTVADQAVVKSFSTISGRAEISGEALVQGNAAKLAFVGEYAKVYGNAKIYAGTTVTGKAQVFGGATLYSSSVRDDAQVCLGQVIEGQEIIDDSYCNPDGTSSSSEIKLSNVSADKLNYRPQRVDLKLEGSRFSSNVSSFEISLNGSRVDAAKLLVSGSVLRILTPELISDGENEIFVSAFDEFGKKIERYDLSFWAGSSKTTIPVPQGVPSDLKLQVKLEINGETLQVPYQLGTSDITLIALPSDLSSGKLTMTGFSDEGVIAEQRLTSAGLTSSLEILPLPKFINNDLDLSSGFSTWSISEPSAVTIENVGGRQAFGATPISGSPVRLSKTFHLGSDAQTLSIDLAYSGSGGADQDFLRVVTVNHASKLVDIKVYSPDSFSRSQTSPGILRLQLANNDGAGDQTVMVELSSIDKAKNSAGLYVYRPEVLSGLVTFEAKTFGVKNKGEPNENEIPLTDAADTDCSDVTYQTPNAYTTDASEAPIKFLSAGGYDSMPLVLSNRIHGQLSVTAPENSIIESIVLAGFQDGAQVFVAPLSRCASRALQASNREFTYGTKNNLVKFPFDIPKYLTNGVVTAPGSTIILVPRATFRSQSGATQTLDGNSTNPLQVLVASTVGGIFFSGGDNTDVNSPGYNPFGVDHYDSKVTRHARVGGDKWILPFYEPQLWQILNTFFADGKPEWGVNDMTANNGSPFPPHKGHNLGTDADVRFNDFSSGAVTITHNFKIEYSEASWQKLLAKIEDFLVRMRNYYPLVNYIFMERSGSANAADYINKKFEHRCLEGRYIKFGALARSGSLLRDVAPHKDHLHLAFMQTRVNGSPVIRDLSVANLVNYDLNDFVFSTDGEGKTLRVVPLPGTDMTDKAVLWRFQDKDGYDDMSVKVSYGSSGTPLADGQEDSYGSINSSSRIRYIKLAIANENGRLAPKSVVSNDFANSSNGGCIERSIAINLDTAKRPMRWTYQRVNGEFKAVAYE